MGVNNNNNNYSNSGSNIANNNNKYTTEHDAAHIRFREKNQNDMSFCCSCSDTIRVTSILDIIEHYSNKIHYQHHSDCLYCKGKVHQYKDSKNVTNYYHDCGRWKRHEDK